MVHNGLRVCAVADKKHLPVRLAQSFLEAQTFDLPLHPLLPHTRCYHFGVLFRPFVCRTFWSCGWTDTLFAKLGFERWLERLGNVWGCEGMALYYLPALFAASSTQLVKFLFPLSQSQL